MTQTSTAAAAAGPLSDHDLALIDAYWRAANYLSVGQIYLLDNPLLREPPAPRARQAAPARPLGNDPGPELRLRAHEPGDPQLGPRRHLRHRARVTAAPRRWPTPTSRAPTARSTRTSPRTRTGCAASSASSRSPAASRRTWPPRRPGSIHEGGELGYALSHAYGAAFDNPDLLVACVVGDGEAETGPLATGWHSNKFLDPATDGAVLPILHLNGYKIANPTVLARIPEEELTSLLEGYGHSGPLGRQGDDPATMHQLMAATLDTVIDEITAIQKRAREGGDTTRPRWPMIVLKSPKGWTGPKTVDGLPTEGTWRSHQVPLAEVRTNPDHLALLEAWMQELPPRGALRRARGAHRRAGRAAAQELPPDERQPARQRRPAAPGPGPARLPQLRGRGGHAGRRPSPRPPGCWGPTSAT